MAAKRAELLLKNAWREQWTVEVWVDEVARQISKIDENQLKDFKKSLTAGLIQYSVSSLSEECQYQSYVKDSLISELFSTLEVVDYICKADKFNDLKQLDVLLGILEDSVTCISRTYNGDDSMNLAVSLAKCACWLLGTIATMIKAVFNNSRQESTLSSVQHHFDIAAKCFQLFNKIMDSPWIQDIVLVGKIEVQEEQELILQTKLNDLMSLKPETLNNKNISLQYQNSLKQLMNSVARFLNSTLTGMMSQNRKPGHIPSHSLQTLAELQVIDNLFSDSAVMADLFDFVLRFENIPMDQFYVDLMRCGYHGILTAANTQDELLWASFTFFKIPSIINSLRFKYQQSGLDDTIFFTACKQFAQMNVLIDELDVFCKFRCLPNFLLKCQEKGLLDKGKIEIIMSQAPSNEFLESAVTSDRNPVGSVLNATRTVKDILQLLLSPWEEKKEIIRQQLTQLTNSSELSIILATAAGMDQLPVLVDNLIRLNDNTKGPVSEPNEDPSFAEIRADIFNVTFVLLSYITAVFGVKILSTINTKEAFFVTWRMNCSADVGQKRYSPMALDMILEQVMASNLPSIIAVLAKWDDYCLCAGAVIKELSQALECGAIVVDKIQKVCETFKNKRPALCICASSWLCTQYNSMPAQKRDVTIKILRAFRGHGAQRTSRSEFMAKIIEDLAGTIVLEQLNTGKGKHGKIDMNKGAAQENVMSEILKRMVKFPGSPRIDKKSLSELRKQLKLLSPAGFCKVFIKTILNSGKIDEAKAFEVLCSTIILIDPVTLTPALLQDAMPSIIHQSGAHSLLSDPQGGTLARFICKSVAYAFIHVKTDNSNDMQRPQKKAKLEIQNDIENKNRQKIIESLGTFLEELIVALRWNQVGSILLFLSSLLEQLFISTMHLTPSLKLPQYLGQKLLKVLPGKVSNEILMLIFNTEDPEQRKELVHRICKKMQLTQT